MNYQFQLLPELAATEYDALKADIAQNGVLVPVEVDEHGTTLDGHHRIRAWSELRTSGVRVAEYPRIVRTFRTDDEKVEHALRINLNRRHLDRDQLKAIAIDRFKDGWNTPRVGDVLAIDPETARRWRDEYKSVSADAETDLPIYTTGKDGKSYPTTKPRAKKSVVATNERQEKQAHAAMAALADFDTSDDEQVDQDTGEIETAADAQRETKERRRQATRDENAAAVSTVRPLTEYVAGQTFQTIVIDPPWDWGDEGDIDQFGRGRPTYDTMSIDQIKAMPVGDVAEKNAHLYLWITNRSLPKGFDLLDAWGFRYITMLTWCKRGIGMGNYFRGSTEHILFGVCGSLEIQDRSIGTWFSAARADLHSAKPAEAYDLIERASPGPWLDVFARTERAGWVTWGEGSQ